MRNKGRLKVGAFVASLAIAGIASFAIVQAAEGDSGADAESASISNVKGFAAADIRRESLTKILMGMEINGAPDDAKAPIEAELNQLGGSDPSVKPLDGPDNQREWAYQAAEDDRMCSEGDEDACDALPDAEENAGSALAEIKAAEAR